MVRSLLAFIAAMTLLVSTPLHAADTKPPTFEGVDSLTELRRLKTQPLQTRLTDGSMCAVKDVGSSVIGLYVFKKGSTTAESGTAVVKPNDNSGRWFLVASSTPGSPITGLATATPAAVGTAAVGTATLVARSDHVHAHGAQATGANSHDADQIDFELADGSKKQIGAASDALEAALTDIDAAFGAAVSTLTTTTKTLVGALNELAAMLIEKTATVGAKLMLFEGTNNGANKMTIQGPALLGADRSLTFGDDDYSMATIKTGATAGSAAKVVTDEMLSVAGGGGGQLYLKEPVAGGTSQISFEAPALASSQTVAMCDAPMTLCAVLPASTTAAATLTLAEDVDNGTDKAILSAPQTLAANATITLPDVTTTLFGYDFYDANTVVYATADNTPLKLTVGASTVVGRGAAGDIVALATVSTTTGAPDAGKVLILDANGGTTGFVQAGGSSIWFKKTITAADLNDADGDETETVLSLAGRDHVVYDMFFVLNTECAGGAVNAATVELGTDGDPDGFVTPENVWTGAGTGRKGHTPADKGALAVVDDDDAGGSTKLGSIYQDADGGSIVARFLTTAGNLADLTACSVTAYVNYGIVAGN